MNADVTHLVFLFIKRWDRGSIFYKIFLYMHSFYNKKCSILLFFFYPKNFATKSTKLEKKKKFTHGIHIKVKYIPHCYLKIFLNEAINYKINIKGM